MRDSVRRLSIFIDGGHYNAIQKYYKTNFDFTLFIEQVRTCLNNQAGQFELLHIFYYDCLPYTNGASTPEEREALTKCRSYFNFLRAQPAVRVREGVLVKHIQSNGEITLQQKRVDLLLGLDIAEECNKQLMSHMVLVSGDADLIPAVEYASHKGVQVWLFHAPRTSNSCADTLWSAADGRIEISTEFTTLVSKSRPISIRE